MNIYLVGGNNNANTNNTNDNVMKNLFISKQKKIKKFKINL